MGDDWDAGCGGMMVHVAAALAGAATVREKEKEKESGKAGERGRERAVGRDTARLRVKDGERAGFEEREQQQR